MRRDLQRHDGPFGIVPAWVQKSLHGKAGRNTAKALYLTLATAANYTTRQVRITRKALADDLECTMRTVDRAIDVLIEAGAVTVKRGRDDSLYTLLPKVDRNVYSEQDENVYSGVDKNDDSLRIVESIPTGYDQKKTKRKENEQSHPDVAKVWATWKALLPDSRVCPAPKIARLLVAFGGPFEADDLCRAIEKAMADEFWKSHGPLWVIRSPENVDRMLTLQRSKLAVVNGHGNVQPPEPKRFVNADKFRAEEHYSGNRTAM